MWKKVDLSLVNYWSILRKRKWFFFSAFLIVFSIVILYTHIQRPIYRAFCSIKLIEPKSFTGITGLPVSPIHYNLVSSAAMTLTSKPIIEKVIYQLVLVNEKTTPRNLEKTILAIQRATRTKVELGENIMQIRVDYNDAETAAKIANAIAEIYIKVDADKKGELARNFRISIEGQLAKVKQGLSEAENNLKTFKEQEGESVSGIALVMENNILTLEKQQAELIKEHDYDHIDVVKIKEQVEDLTKQLKFLPENEIKFLELTRKYEAEEKAYRQLQSEFEDVSIAEKEKIQDVKVISPATTPQTPIKPNKRLTVIIAIIAGIIIGEFAAITAEAFRL